MSYQTNSGGDEVIRPAPDLSAPTAAEVQRAALARMDAMPGHVRRLLGVARGVRAGPFAGRRREWLDGIKERRIHFTGSNAFERGVLMANDIYSFGATGGLADSPANDFPTGS